METAEAIELAEEALDLLDEIENEHERVWMRGLDFFEDVGEKLRSVLQTFESSPYDNVTDKQASAVKNWLTAIKKWHPDY